MADWIAGSFSRIDTFMRCPKKFYHMNVRKDVPYMEGTSQKEGKVVHSICEKRILQAEPYPPGYEYLDKWIAPLLAAPGNKHAELNICVDRDLQPCGSREWDRVYMRCQVDYMGINGENALQLDWKTGKTTSYDGFQLDIGAAIAMQHFPEVNYIGSAYVYLGPGVMSDPKTYTRHDLPGIWDKVHEQMAAIDTANRIGDWPAKRNKYCAWCPVNRLGKCPEAGVAPRA